jgi:hypothetical protein
MDELAGYCLNISGTDAADIARCCPALKELGVALLDEHVEADDLAPLLQLSGLRELSIAGEGCTDGVAEAVLAKLTGGPAASFCMWCRALQVSAIKPIQLQWYLCTSDIIACRAEG